MQLLFLKNLQTSNFLYLSLKNFFIIFQIIIWRAKLKNGTLAAFSHCFWLKSSHCVNVHFTNCFFFVFGVWFLKSADGGDYRLMIICHWDECLLTRLEGFWSESSGRKVWVKLPWSRKVCAGETLHTSQHDVEFNLY